jgi:anaerobic selenocysteine-containing dehydrogenase
MGIDRPSPDHANAEVIFLISAHLETGHYFNPHAQRITEAKANGAKLIVLDVRLSNTATHADHWLAPYPGSEAAICLAIANHLIRPAATTATSCAAGGTGTSTSPPSTPSDRPSRPSRRSWPSSTPTTPSSSPRPSRASAAETLARGRRAGRRAGTPAVDPQLAVAAAGQRGRLAGLAHPVPAQRPARRGGGAGRHLPQRVEQVRRRSRSTCPRTRRRGTSSPGPLEYPLAQNELSLPAAPLPRGGPRPLDVYFTRVYNPVWTNPDGFSWIEMLTDEDKVGLHVALTPTWNETAYFADYVLPMGLSSERHDITPTSSTTGSGSASASRCCAPPASGWARRHRHPGGQPGRGVGGERVLDRAVVADRPRRLARHPPLLRVPRASRARSSGSTSTTAGCSSTRCPGCPRPPRPRG